MLIHVSWWLGLKDTPQHLYRNKTRFDRVSRFQQRAQTIGSLGQNDRAVWPICPACLFQRLEDHACGEFWVEVGAFVGHGGGGVGDGGYGLEGRTL